MKNSRLVNRRTIRFLLILFGVPLFLAYVYILHVRPALVNQKCHRKNEIKDHSIFISRELNKRTHLFSNDVQPGVRGKELTFARTLPKRESVSPKLTEVIPPDWRSNGPDNMGGRTRALAIDMTNDNIIMAAGVTGGLWRSTNGGVSWSKVTGSDQVQIVSCIVQDTRPGKTSVWYYGTGERRGSRYPGDGVFKSTDNGITWTQLPSTASNMPQDEGISFNWCWNIALDPSNQQQDEVYVAAEGAIFRSMDGGDTWEIIFDSVIYLEEYEQYDEVPTDVAVTSGGVVYATIGSPFWSDDTDVQGVWRSPDGVNWTDITPGEFGTNFSRIVMGITPSDENIVYFLASIGNPFSIRFQRYTYISGNGAGEDGDWQELTENLYKPGYTQFWHQGNYCLVVAVKPDNPDIVYAGGVFLFRSTDGFSTKDNTKVSGEHHVDQHAIVFSHSDPDIVYVGNDGGVYRTTDDLAAQHIWTSLNDGYTTTQFYNIAINRHEPGKDLFIGGTQDNGALFTSSSLTKNYWTRVLGGDVLDCAISEDGDYYLSGFGDGSFLWRIEVNEQGERTSGQDIQHENAGYSQGCFVLDPNDNNMMYYSAGIKGEVWNCNYIWRNSKLDQAYSDEHWEVLSNSRIEDHITAIGVSASSPSHRLYCGSGLNSPGVRLYRIDDVHHGDPTMVEITGPEFPSVRFTYVNSIAVDPRDGDNVLVAVKGYHTKSLFYSEDGGSTWSHVSGNLEENPDGSGNGPSVYAAAILPLNNGRTFYIVGTSTGLYSTTELKSSETIWLQEGMSSIGYVPVLDIDTRSSDGCVVVATHGNGVFSANIDLNKHEHTIPEDFSLHQNYPNPFNAMTTIRFEVPEETMVIIKVYNLHGQEVSTLTEKNYPAGKHDVRWNADNLPSGTYFYKIDAGSFTHTKGMVLRK